MSVDADVRVEEVDAVALPTLPPDEATDSSTLAPTESNEDSPRGAPLRRLGRNRPLMTAWSPFIGLAVVLAIVCIFVTSRQAQWLAAIGGVIALAAVVEAVFAERRQQRVLAQPLTLIGIGLSFVVAGELLHAGWTSLLSYADAVTLLSYPPLVAGLLRLTRARLRESALDTLLVAAIVPASLGVFAWLPMAEAIQRWVPGGNGQTWTAAVLLSVDVLAIAIIARLAMFFRGKPVAYQLLLGAFTCLLGAHVSRIVASLSGLVPAPLGSQTLMLLAFGLIAAAALHPSMRRATRAGRARSVPVGRGHLAMLVVAILFGPVIVIWRFIDQGTWVVVAAAGPAIVSLLVVAHLSRMIRERQRLEFATNHDMLTGLANRSFFHDQVLLALGRSEGSRLAVMFLDLDRFKKVNDSLGHDAGDQLLRLVAERLASCARRSDIVARISGDEFAVLLPDAASADHAEDVAARMLAQFERPFRVAGHSLFMTPSIGIALHPDHGGDVESLLRNADAAMYQAKAAGRNAIRVYDEAMGASAQRQLAVETRMHQAIEDGELRLHYQPKLDVGTGQVLGLEALVRWAHPRHGLIPPKAFIRTAEETGLIAPLGSWVLHNACAQMAAWHAEGHDELNVSVNVSAQQFKLQDVPAMVRSALDESGLPPEALQLELTESVGIDPDGSVGAALVELQTLGVSCTIDDFGTGYSSISYLHEYHVDTIKLDRSFVRDIDGVGDAPIVRAVIAMAHNLGIRVVAEGVETKAQLKFLEKHKCDEVQGFLFSEPLPADEVGPFLDRRAAMTAASRRRAPVAAVVAIGLPAMDAETLGNLLWADSAQHASDELILLKDGEDEDSGGQLRRVGVLFAITGTMVVPVLLGLGAGGGLPPGVQAEVTGAFDVVGIQTPERAPVTAHNAASAEPRAIRPGGSPAAAKADRGAQERRGTRPDDARLPRRPFTSSAPGAVVAPRPSAKTVTSPRPQRSTTPRGGPSAGAGAARPGGGAATTPGQPKKPPAKPKATKGAGKTKKSATTATASGASTPTGTPPATKTKAKAKGGGPKKP